MLIHITAVSLLLSWYLGIIICQDGICFSGSGKYLCCADYRKINGTCQVCPKGTYGYGCAKPCPEGYYGEACRSACKCKSGQICDRAYGCLKPITKACPEGYFGDDCQNTRKDLPTEMTCKGECDCQNAWGCDTTSKPAQMTTKSTPQAFTRYPISTEIVNTQETHTTYFSESQKKVMRLYIWSGLAVYIFIFTAVVLLVKYRRKKRRRENGKEGRIRSRKIGVSIGKLQQTLPTETPPLPLKPEERVSSDPDYAEILDCDPDYLEPCAVSRVSDV